MKALRKILVVDDDPVVGKSFNRVLNGKGYVVITAHDGPEALKRLAEGEYDLVVTDIRMPGMDGIEVAERVKAKRPWTPVVIVTGYGTDDNETRARAAGVSSFIRKPLSPEMIEDSARFARIEGAPAPAVATLPVAEPVEMTAAPAARRGVMRILETAAMMIVAPIVALAYVVAAPVVGLAMLVVAGLSAMAHTRLARYARNAALMLAAPVIGLAYALAMPVIGLGALVWLGVKELNARGIPLRVARRTVKHAKNVTLFFAAPFVGLAYALAFPFIGIYLLVRATRKRNVE